MHKMARKENQNDNTDTAEWYVMDDNLSYFPNFK